MSAGNTKWVYRLAASHRNLNELTIQLTLHLLGYKIEHFRIHSSFNSSLQFLTGHVWISLDTGDH